MQLSLDEFLNLRNQLPLLDVRSEGEYAVGHIRGATNVPLLTDAERTVVGTTYKQFGQREAIREGFRLVGPRLLEMVTTAEKIADGKEVLVHCWRGGMRSENFSHFIGMAGVRSQVLAGGYKAYRQGAMNSFKFPMKLLSLTGCTGSGKSEVLRELERQGQQILDLEGLANHRGSAFGGLLLPPQPTTEQFQNDLFEKLQSLDLEQRIWVEDESIAIGKIFLPGDFWTQMHRSPLVRMEVPKKVRVERLVNEYGPADRDEFLSIMSKISKKLGGQNFLAAKEKLQENDMAAAIDILLTYYDKAYLQSMEKRKEQLRMEVPWDGNDVQELVRDLIKNS